MLSIIATPIGNLKDITLRALEVLQQSNAIICEDTRRTGLLLHHFLIKKPMIVLNDYNEAKQVPFLVSKLKTQDMALVSDAGTPLISDPGFKLVRECIKDGIKVESIPGPSAVLTGLTCSGLPTDKFFFVGFPAKGEGKRKKLLNDVRTMLVQTKFTVILFESPHKLIRTLEELKAIFGDIDIVICRELTKLHEEVRREKISQSIEHFTQTPPKGEFTILF